jgi:hypothetical protein
MATVRQPNVRIAVAVHGSAENAAYFRDQRPSSDRGRFSSHSAFTKASSRSYHTVGIAAFRSDGPSATARPESRPFHVPLR